MRGVQCPDCAAKLVWALPAEIRRRTVPLRVRVLTIDCGVFFALHPLAQFVLGVLGRWASARSLGDVIKGRAWRRGWAREKGISRRRSHCHSTLVRGMGCRMGLNLSRRCRSGGGGGGSGDVDGNGVVERRRR